MREIIILNTLIAHEIIIRDTNELSFDHVIIDIVYFINKRLDNINIVFN